MRQLSGAGLVELQAQALAEGRRLTLLDVREAWEVALASIEIAGCDHLAIPMNSVPDRLDALDRVQPLVCICHHGARSAQVVAFLEQHGFGSAYNLAGGIDAWSISVDPAVPRY
ncbi:MAG: rhodanese-like domain-containing protein [Caldimonas sp.]